MRNRLRETSVASDTVFRHACKLWLEGIARRQAAGSAVSVGAIGGSGQDKNLDAPAVTRSVMLT